MQQRVLIELCRISCACAYDRIKCQLISQVSLEIYFDMPNMQLKQRTESQKRYTATHQNHQSLDQDKAVQCQQQNGGNQYRLHWTCTISNGLDRSIVAQKEPSEQSLVCSALLMTTTFQIPGENMNLSKM